MDSDPEPSPAWRWEHHESTSFFAPFGSHAHRRTTHPPEVVPSVKSYPSIPPDIKRTVPGPTCLSCGRTGCHGHPKVEE